MFRIRGGWAGWAWAAWLWLAAVTAGYFVLHKPVTPENAAALAQCIWRTAVAFTIISICGGLGRRIIPKTAFHPLAEQMLQASLGAGIVAIGVLAVGWLGGYYSWVALLAVLFLSFLWRREIVGWWQGWYSVRTLWKESSRFGRCTAGLISILITAAYLSALAPPIQFDALVYHLALPEYYLAAHRFFYVPDLMFWGMPQTAEMLYTWAAALGGHSAALVLGWMAGLVALAGVVGLIAQKFSADAGWVGAAALLSGFTLAASLSWGYTEWWTMLFGAAFLLSILLWNQSGSLSQAALAGIFAGMALGTKYTGGVLILCGTAVIFTSRAIPSASRLKAALCFIFAALLVFSPWLIKNIWATGSPTYPLVFAAGAMTPLRLSLYQGGQPWGSWLDVMFLPFRLTFLGVEGAPGYSASIGPLLLGLALAAASGWSQRNQKEREMIRLAAIVTISGLMVWMAAGRFSSYLLQARLYIGLFPAFAVLAAAGYEGLARFRHNGVRFGAIAGAVVILVLGLSVLEAIVELLDQGAAVQAFGRSTQKEYLDDNLGWFSPVMEAVNQLPAESKVLMLFEARSLYCLPVCTPDETIDRWLRERHDGANAARSVAEILQRWQSEGYTHLLFHKAGAEYVHKNESGYAPQDWTVLTDLLSGLENRQDFGDAYQLYRIEP